MRLVIEVVIDTGGLLILPFLVIEVILVFLVLLPRILLDTHALPLLLL